MTTNNVLSLRSTSMRREHSKMTAGPTSRSVGLSQLHAGLPATRANVHEYLIGVERARLEQLDALPKDTNSVVVAAHRDTLVRIIEQAKAARARIRTGNYGLCVRCRALIRPHVLESEPWQPYCYGCAASDAR